MVKVDLESFAADAIEHMTSTMLRMLMNRTMSLTKIAPVSHVWAPMGNTT